MPPPKPQPNPGAARPLQRGTLWRRICDVGKRAHENGALEWVDTVEEVIEDAGIAFSVRVVAGRDRKLEARAREREGNATANPFLPYEEALFVAEISDTHVCLLNKYNAIPRHTLLVTRTFEEQTSPLTPADWRALWTCMKEYDAIGFYNAGRIAGASQRHRHLQLVPAPIGAGMGRTPIDALFAGARFDAAVGTLPGLPFLHAAARLRVEVLHASEEVPVVLHSIYTEMLRAFGNKIGVHPYNLVVTRDWMLMVPRSQELWETISVNALGFAGALLVRDREQLARLTDAGPMRLLQQVAVTRDL